MKTDNAISLTFLGTNMMLEQEIKDTKLLYDYLTNSELTMLETLRKNHLLLCINLETDALGFQHIRAYNLNYKIVLQKLIKKKDFK